MLTVREALVLVSERRAVQTFECVRKKLRIEDW